MAQTNENDEFAELLRRISAGEDLRCGEDGVDVRYQDVVDAGVDECEESRGLAERANELHLQKETRSYAIDHVGDYDELDATPPNRRTGDAPEVLQRYVDPKFGQQEFRKIETGFTYNMDHPRRGTALIINNKIFRPDTYMNVRNGTEVDGDRLKKLFNKMGFDTVVKNNLECRDMQLEIEQATKYRDHSDADCFVLAILTHGVKDHVYGTNGTVPLEELLKPLKQTPSLVGKPKIVIMQACMGNKLDDGIEKPKSVDAVDASESKSCRLPQEADILFVCSTVQGYFAWRNAIRGSHFIQAFCDVMEQYAYTKEILHVMTRVTHHVATDFESSAMNKHLSGKKQCPCVISQLTKELYFSPKNEK